MHVTKGRVPIPLGLLVLLGDGRQLVVKVGHLGLKLVDLVIQPIKLFLLALLVGTQSGLLGLPILELTAVLVLLADPLLMAPLQEGLLVVDRRQLLHQVDLLVAQVTQLLVQRLNPLGITHLLSRIVVSLVLVHLLLMGR